MYYKLAHPKALKDSTPYSQASRIKQICSKTSKVIMHFKDAFIKRGYQFKILEHHFARAMSIDRKILLENKEKPSTQGNLLLVLIFNKTIPNIKNVIDQHWHILFINENLWKVFDKRPFIAYRRNTNLYQLIGGNHTFKNKFIRTNTKQPKQSRHCSQCLQEWTIFVVNKWSKTKTFQSYRTKKSFQIFHNLTCKSENLIYNAVYANLVRWKKWDSFQHPPQ